MARRRPGRYDVIDDQHPAAERRADDAAAFAVRFRLLAVIAERNIHVLVLGQRGRRQCGERDALVSRAKNHVEANAGLGNCRGVITPEPGHSVAGVEQPRVEEVGADASGLERKLAKAQYAELECKVDEFSFVGLHEVVFLYDGRL